MANLRCAFCTMLTVFRRQFSEIKMQPEQLTNPARPNFLTKISNCFFDCFRRNRDASQDNDSLDETRHGQDTNSDETQNSESDTATNSDGTQNYELDETHHGDSDSRIQSFRQTPAILSNINQTRRR